MKSVAVVGAGISGVSCSRLLKDLGFNVVLYEAASKPGGLVRCSKERHDVLYHRVGGHVFNTKNDRVAKWFWSKVNQNDFVLAERNAKILLEGSFVNYPIECNLASLGEEKATAILGELLLQDGKQSLAAKSFSEYLYNQFGPTLCDLYFIPYNEKIWGMPLAEMGVDWLEGKLPSMNLKDILLSNILGNIDDGMVHSEFYYPKSGGSQYIIDTLATDLVIKNNHPVKNIDLQGSKLVVDEQGIYDAVVFTGDVRSLAEVVSDTRGVLSRGILSQVADFQSHGTSSMLCECDDFEASWLYIPDKDLLPHRIIHTGQFSKLNNGSSERSTCVVEFSGLVSKSVMLTELPRLPFNLVPLAMNYEPNTYVIQRPSDRKIIQGVKTELLENNLFLTGRFADWEYYNMDTAINASMATVDDIVARLG